ncbi:MAG TPA: class I SAM-dependent methyltransferase, partial [Candidatus Hydrogenedentes bacterium]|nr:class I SAM-dependent methyltransferase [Candidatus Hydrogenedentota bacterium]
MAEDQKTSTKYDPFAPIANHYDDMMEHVCYERWLHVTRTLGEMLPGPFSHLDAGCGTGILLKKLREHQWRSVGMDLSPTMLRVARYRHALQRLVNGDFSAPPFVNHFMLITCL